MGEQIRLSELKPGHTGEISQIAMEGSKKRRLLDLGFTEGTKIKCIGETNFKSPRAYALRGTVIALRTADAGDIYVKVEETV